MFLLLVSGFCTTVDVLSKFEFSRGAGNEFLEFTGFIAFSKVKLLSNITKGIK